MFISSTLGELADERRAARSAVEQLRLIPVLFELGARPHPPRALYRAYLEQSDVFVAIYWQRYGWVAPDMDISGLEDELVLSDGMPRLVYVKRPAPDMEPRLAEMLDRLQALDAVSYKPFADAHELRDLLVDDLAVLLTERFDGDVPAPEDRPPGPSHNLPSPTSTFLGRDTEIHAVRELLATDGVRLVTLTGPGGSGKTRLAIQVAGEEVDHFADGVCFVDLSAERDVDGAFAAVARSAQVAVPAERQPIDALKDALRDRSLLLVLDNFEQVIHAAAGVVELLESCPLLSVLVTSREALRVRGERIVPVPPLSLPDPDAGLAVNEAEAVRLFCDRAAAVQPGFRLDERNASAIADICRQLDGLPLAIELAAARVQLFDVEELRVRLADRLEVLSGGARDLPRRQRTLHDAIAWSYDLLDDDERRLCRVFAVFPDARLRDVEATAARIADLRGIDVIEAMGSLLAKNLVRSTNGPDGRPRFSMLQTIRAYALDQLAADPELAVGARRGHAEHYTEVAVQLHHQVTYAGRAEVLSALGNELGNLRAAWREWTEQAHLARLNDLLAPLWGYYDARGDYRSAIELGTDLLEQLARVPDSPERRRDEFVVRMNVVRTELAVRGLTADAEQMILGALAQVDEAGGTRERFPGLRSLAYLHLMRSDFEEVQELAHELMAIAVADQDGLLLCEAHLLAGLVSSWREDLPVALAHLAEAVEHFESTRSGYVDFRVGPNPGVVALVVQGLTEWMSGLPETGVRTLERALALAAELDHPYSVAYATHHAGLLDLWRDDLAGLRSRTDALLAIANLHDYPTWRALALVFGGVAMVGLGEVETGLERVEEGFELYQGLSAPPVFWPPLLTMRARVLAAAGRGDEALASIRQAEAALQRGDLMALDVAIAHGDLLLALTPSDPAAAEALFEGTVEAAGPRGARMAQLQALTRLARLRQGTPAATTTHAALEEVYGSFTEGFDTAHLAAARVVLDRAHRVNQVVDNEP